MTKPPKAPKGLQTAGRRLWRDLHEPDSEGRTLDFRPDERPLVVELCHLVGDVERIRAALGDELLAEGSKGQHVPHPLRVELHRSAQRVESIVKTLNIPDEGAGSASWSGRRLARARWSA